MSSRLQSRKNDLERAEQERLRREARHAGEIPIASWSTTEKVEEAVRRSFPLLPSYVARQLEAVLTPEALAVIVVIVGAWAGSHFLGVGAAADLVLLVVGVAALGLAAIDGGQALYFFAERALRARSEEDLDRAGKYFAEAVTLLGVEVVLALLFRARPKVFQHANFKPSPPPPPSGRFRYKPTLTRTPKRPAGEGGTTEWGDIEVSIWGSPAAQRITEIHERVHSALTPKLYFLRNIRVAVRANGYVKSELLRYLEEAIAESVAQLRVLGRSGLRLGIRFPVKNGYVTLAGMAEEARGILLGPVNVAGISLFAWFEASR